MRGSSVWRCSMLSDLRHGSRQHHFLKLAKTGLIRAQCCCQLSLWRQQCIHLCLVLCSLNLTLCPLSLECSIKKFLRDSGVPWVLWSCMWGCTIWVYHPPHRQNIRSNMLNPASVLGLIALRLGVRVVQCPAYRPLCHAWRCSRVGWY
jgi:hypothetical protein